MYVNYSGTDFLVASIAMVVQNKGKLAPEVPVLFYFLVWIVITSVLGFWEFIKSYIHDFSTFLYVFYTSTYNKVEEPTLE